METEGSFEAKSLTVSAVRTYFSRYHAGII